MSDFYKKFLLDEERRSGGSSRQVFLAAFGKHPGWDDHVEDLGLESQSLILAKTLLYVQGIGGQIDKGDWEKLDAQQQLPVFKHVFLWQRAGQVLIGRLWSSSDGKGRTRYPMIVCAQATGVSLAWALEQVLPRLEKIEQECQATGLAADVRFILTSGRNSLRAAINDVATEVAPSPALASKQELARFVAHSAMGPNQEGWFRLLYQMQSQMAAFAPGRFSLKGDLVGLRAQQLRVPSCGDSPAQTLLWWSRFFQSQLDPAVPFLLTLPLDEPWLDATVGEPASQEFFCLRASPKAVPLATEVPYNLDAEFRKQAATTLANLQTDPPPAKTLPANGQKAAVSAALGSTKQKLLKWFGGGAALLIAITLMALFLFGQRKEKAQAFKATAPQTNASRATGPPVVPAPISKEVKDNNTTPQAPQADAAQKMRLAAEAEAKRLERLRIAEEKQKAEAARALQEREQARLAAEAETKRLAEEKARMEAAAKETARKTANPEASEKTLIAAAVPAPVKPESAAPAGLSNNAGSQFTNSVGMVLVRVPGNYWVGKFEVTQGEYQKVMGFNPSRSKDRNDPRLPVESVSWNDAMKFCQELTSRDQAAGVLPAGFSYSLPTEKQWQEYRGDARLDQAVTLDAGEKSGPARVGSTGAPNQFGLFDVYGNVWEWCLDERTFQKLSIGLGYNSYQKYPLTKYNPPDKAASSVGFRCVLIAQP